ncbi:hypothetical protein RKE29_26870 [Streptomyces sp. B1866]|uniref:Rv1733c family protein n=1 Tax=Streptomyces sp. B1866 TaxID=3075431 RepID=UPI0028910E2E|nr:hypothetical protein [Streptomyces sp. B1866]MDT3400199.1 hypothetical protein [Streptomyces sp. B1866]
MRDKVKLWRRRPNPLRRGSDVAEAWVGLAVAALVAVGAPAAGVLTGATVDDAMLRQSREWRRTPAVLLERSPDAEAGLTVAGQRTRVRATVRWTAENGTPHTGRALVAPRSEAGSRISVWLDRQGHLRNDPATPEQALMAGVVGGTSATVLAGCLALGCGKAVRMGLDAARAARWEREWAEIGPRWNQHTP